jgi:hypothetical protein
VRGRTRAELEELATTLPGGPVTFTGELGEGAGTELYEAVAAALAVLSRDSAVTVDFSRDNAFRVLVTAQASRLSAAGLRATLEPETERVAKSGGSMTCAVAGGAAVVGIRLPPPASVLYQRICELVRQGQETAGPDRPRWDVVAEELSHRSHPRATAVKAAREALASLHELTKALPPNHPLRWGVDRIGADTHEIAELDLLADLERDGTRLLRGATAADAARLLGAHGTDPHTRLGLTKDADDAQIRHAAGAAVQRWRAQAERPGTDWQDRTACEVLARTAEGMFGI